MERARCLMMERWQSWALCSAHRGDEPAQRLSAHHTGIGLNVASRSTMQWLVEASARTQMRFDGEREARWFCKFLPWLAMPERAYPCCASWEPPSSSSETLPQVPFALPARPCQDVLNFRGNGPEDTRILPIGGRRVLLFTTDYHANSLASTTGGHPSDVQYTRGPFVQRAAFIDGSQGPATTVEMEGTPMRLRCASSAASATQPAKGPT